ncbi:MAG: NAD(P)/FAD-dependent oxidoreductase [Bacteroidota bacterium]
MTSNNAYQTAVIGGGLAGLTLAIQLQREGISTVLFEKETYPFHKVCGEYISMESRPFLESLGVPLSGLNLPVIHALHITSPNGTLLKHTLQQGGFGISRFTLDNMLFEVAKKCGVTVYENCKVNGVLKEENGYSIQTSRGTFSAQVACGSWGKRSNLDVKLNRRFIHPVNRKLTNYIAVKYHVEADLPDDLIELHNFGNGYCGISKIDNGKYCLCYLTVAQNLKSAGGDIKKMEEMFLHKNPYLEKYFTTFKSLYHEPLVISQISFEKKSLVENGVFMLGDSAGLITPLCGNGMSMAMHASKLLAAELVLFFDGKRSLALTEVNYHAAWEQQFKKRLKAGRLLQRLFGHAATTNVFIALMKRFPSLVNKLVQRTHGEPF